MEEGREWSFPCFLYVDDLVLCGESEEHLKAMVRRFVEVCRRRNLKVNAGNNKVVMLGGEVCVDGMRLEQVSGFKYLGCVLDESGIGETECRRNMPSGKRVPSAI